MPRSALENPPVSIDSPYATHLPSGEKTGSVDLIPAKAVAFLSGSESIQRLEPALPDAFVAEYARRLSIAHDSGTCSSPAAAVVSRSAIPVPSARWRNSPNTDSALDEYAIHWPSGDQIGYQLGPTVVSR